MKTPTIVVGLVVVLAGAYAGATYHYSKRAEAHAAAWAQKVAATSPYVKVDASDYKRGFLSSTQDVTIELTGPKTGKAGTVTLHNVIHHGPLPGFTSVGIARIDHSLVFDAATSSELAKVFGGASPLTAVTTVNLAGDGRTELKGAPATYTSPDGTVTWQGLTGTLQFAKDMSSYSGDLAAPGLVATGKDGNVSLKSLAVKMSQSKMPNTEKLYLGTVDMKVDAVSVLKDGKPEFEMKNLAMSSNVSSKNPEFLDVVGRVAAAEVHTATFNATDMEYAFSVGHLHAPSLDKLSKAMEDAQEAARSKGGDMAQGAIMQAMATHGMALLQREPVITIERIGFKTKEGETRITGSAKLVGVDASDAQNPMALIMKVQAEATIKVAEAVIATFMPMAPPTDKLAELVNQGYVVRENGILTSKLAFKQGVFTVNDKPFNPAAMAQ